MSELAARAKRRRRKRVITTTGVAVVGLGFATFLMSTLSSRPTEIATVADRGDEEPSDTTQTTTSPTSDLDEGVEGPSSTAGTPSTSTEIADATQAPSTTEAEPVTTPGIRTSTTTTSAWEDGYCVQIDVANENGDRRSWQVVLDVDGSVASVWNANVTQAAGGLLIFSGEEGYNQTIEPGASTSFGTCIDTDPT